MRDGTCIVDDVSLPELHQRAIGWEKAY